MGHHAVKKRLPDGQLPDARALINAFNQRQWQADPAANGLDNTCTISATSCTVSTDTFGQLLNTRAPREIQLGLCVIF